MARFAFLLLVVGAAAADTACPDGVCPADADEHSALLQHKASVAVNLSANAYLAWPPPSGSVYCGANPAKTCGNLDIDCWRDTSGCSTSGGGSGCMAAGTSYPPAAGTSGSMNQCRFCGNTGSPACPPAVNCCTANTLSCYSCQAGMSEDELCKSFPETVGCPGSPTPCCLAMTAECLACQAGQTVTQFCTASAANAKVSGCTSSGPQCPNSGSNGYMQDCESSYSNGYWYGCCQRGLWCTPTNSGMGSQMTCQAIPASLAQVKITALNASDCNINDTPGNVQCPGSSSMCIGDQCCPGVPESGGQTFPCPSATNITVANCVNSTKLATCPIPAPALAQVKIETLNASDCTINDTPGNVQCPHSSSMCIGNQCCPGVPESGGQTFPCPSATNITVANCVNSTKLATCPIPAPALAQVKITALNASDCNINDTPGNVQCPHSSSMCIGNQCCPGVSESGGQTFPCPSATNITEANCVNSTKLATCPDTAAGALAQVKKHY